VTIIILGAGRVGGSVAEGLVSEANDITVIDTDGMRVADLQERFDLRGLVGNATLPSTRREAGAADADLLIAVTSTDETNLVACKVAADLYNVPTRIARFRNVELPRGATMGAVAGGIGEGARVLIAHHDTLIESDDHLIVFVANERMIQRVEKLFAVGVGFF
jgi:Trk K+ transport system NAD-binding subunit